MKFKIAGCRRVRGMHNRIPGGITSRGWNTWKRPSLPWLAGLETGEPNLGLAPDLDFCATTNVVYPTNLAANGRQNGVFF